MDITEIQSILTNMGERVPPSSILVLVGGSALTLLGSPRLTIDIDFVGDDVHPNKLHQFIMQIAKELEVHVEPVPIDRFIPLPKGSEERQIRIGQFGNLGIYVADPYSIALSKLDRGFDTDLEDVIFLIQNNFIVIEKLERITYDALPYARQFDLSSDILDRLEELKNSLK